MKSIGNCEWRVFGVVDDGVRRAIESLKLRHRNGGIHMTDRYLWAQGCCVNAKIREGKLKFKRRLFATSDGIELWSVRKGIAIDTEGLLALENEMNVRAPQRLWQSGFDEATLIQALSEFAPPVKLIEVEKFRTQYLYGAGAREFSVELAEIKRPKRKDSICIEMEYIDLGDFDGSIVDTLRSVRDNLKLPGEMAVMSYLDALESWGK